MTAARRHRALRVTLRVRDSKHRAMVTAEEAREIAQQFRNGGQLAEHHRATARCRRSA
jgi:hypothetical protein